MEEMSTHGRVTKAAMRAGMDRKTARKYVRTGRLPSQAGTERDWRTRADPFAADWLEVTARLRAAPSLEARALFEHLVREKPERYTPGQLRTFQRHVRLWRATEGPEREVFFTQDHRAGEALQTDFTWATVLAVTLGGEPFAHLLCHTVLPYSNWEWATPCGSESLLALRRGIQEALFRLGRVPEWHQTDHSTAATHEIGDGERGFNAEYLRVMLHLGMKPRTIGVGKSEQNGDVEALNGALKRLLEQELLLRESRDFADVTAYEAWLGQVLQRANALRAERVREEFAVMKPLVVSRLAEYDEVEARVTTTSTIRVRYNAYSVPSRLIGEHVRVRVFEDRLEVLLGGSCQLRVPRLHGRGGSRVDYRHIIWSLVRKPGAFERYRYREAMFPTLAFRRAYDALQERYAGRPGDLAYLRVLHLAASTMESDVEAAVELLLEAGRLPTLEQVKGVLDAAVPAGIPAMSAPRVDLGIYDRLLERAGETAP
jgi:hypothetical protein